MRIVSLLPSATEILALVGLKEQLVGVSHECDYPPAVQNLPHVTRSAIHGGLPSAEIDSLVREQLENEQALYHLNMELLHELQPDLIVTQALCDVCAVAASEVDAAACLLPGNPKVINLEPMCLQEVFDTIALVGEETGHQEQAKQALTGLHDRVKRVREMSAAISECDKPRVAFLEWITPLFNAGHWTPELIDYAGGIDCLGSKHQPSHTVTEEELLKARPDVLFVAQCGFREERCRQDLPALTRIPGFDTLPCSHRGELYYTDGNAYFSRPGPRLVDSLEIMAHCLHPERFELPRSLQAAIRFSLTP
ncbi:MAG: cobalamin-binding protein [Pseudomonadales bacterium]|nr:cobalamin-binding protein [Pseudomonadales bacterium]